MLLWLLVLELGQVRRKDWLEAAAVSIDDVVAPLLVVVCGEVTEAARQLCQVEHDELVDDVTPTKENTSSWFFDPTPKIFPASGSCLVPPI